MDYVESMKSLFTKPWLKSLSNLSINLSAAWMAVTFITPKLPISFSEFIYLLTKNLFSGIVLLLLSVELEREIVKYD